MAPSNEIWSISPELPHAAHLAGETVVNLTVDTVAPSTRQVAHLYDIDPDGRAALITRGAIATAATGTKDLSFKLYPQDWVFEPGHRVGVLISAGDDGWYSPGVSQTEVSVTEGALELPLLHFIRDEFIEGDPSKNQGATTLSEDTITAAEVETDMPPAQQPRPEPVEQP